MPLSLLLLLLLLLFSFSTSCAAADAAATGLPPQAGGMRADAASPGERPPLSSAAPEPAQATLLGSQEGGEGGLDLTAFQSHPRVAAYLKWFQGPGRASMDAWLSRGSGYVPWIVRELRDAGLPPELSTIPMIESGFSNTAVSRAGAVGLWQLMPGTARSYGLQVDRFVDERRDPVLATRAAVRHLRDLAERFESPYLAAAAYNAGAGRVLDGLKRLPLADRASEPLPSQRLPSEREPSEWEDLSLPGSAAATPFFRLADKALLARETRNYVPQWIAASLIARDPRRFGFDVAAARAAPASDSLVFERAVRLDEIAEQLGLSPTALRLANPQFLRGMTAPGRRSVVRIPGAVSSDLAERLRTIPDARIPSMAPRLFGGTSRLRGVARSASSARTPFDEEQVRSRLEATARRLSSWGDVTSSAGFSAAYSAASSGASSGASSISYASSRAPSLSSASSPPAYASSRAATETTGSHAPHRIRARRGETLSAVATRYGVSEEDLRRANALPPAFRLRPGQLLLIP
ncbi:MAG: transglycosylase SLT domain-containing protein [Candidatus Eisenbacteria bacterium]|nr:transglycosylase SLT domain-containing protein [Candidatus Eisenbacteria bacterium]